MQPAKTVLLALAFVAMGFAAKVVPWWGLAHVLGKDSVGIPVAGAVLAGCLTWLGLRRFPGLRLSGVTFLPSGFLQDTVRILGGFAAGTLLQAAVVGLSV